MKSKLTVQMQEWIKNEAANSENMLAAARKKNMKKLPVWMALCVAGMVALGLFAYRGDVQVVLKVHLPIGIGIALFVALFTIWQQKCILNKKMLIKAYEKGATAAFNDRQEQDQVLFCHQMGQKDCEEVEFWEKQISFPSKVIIGTDYWVYRSNVTANFVKVSDVLGAHLANSKARISYKIGNTKVKQNVIVGVELIVDYKKDSGVKSTSDSVIYFDNKKQALPVIELIKKYCPQVMVESNHNH